jgi:hypothetical protein
VSDTSSMILRVKNSAEKLWLIERRRISACTSKRRVDIAVLYSADELIKNSLLLTTSTPGSSQLFCDDALSKQYRNRYEIKTVILFPYLLLLPRFPIRILLFRL